MKTKTEVNKDHAWIKPIAQELRSVFPGAYSKLTIREGGEKVYIWERKEPEKPAIKLSMNRKPHKWTDKEDLCLRRK